MKAAGLEILVPGGCVPMAPSSPGAPMMGDFSHVGEEGEEDIGVRAPASVPSYQSDG